jgi:hypothetical protein
MLSRYAIHNRWKWRAARLAYCPNQDRLMHGADTITRPHTRLAVDRHLSPHHRRLIFETPYVHDVMSKLTHTLGRPHQHQTIWPRQIGDTHDHKVFWLHALVVWMSTLDAAFL